jgi:hypothetical protein
MKRILSALLLLATLAVATSLYAASTPLLSSGGGDTLVSSVTVSNNTTKTTGLGESLWIPTHDILGVEFQVTGATISATNAITFTFARSLDGATAASGVWETASLPAVAVTATSTNRTVVLTNLSSSVIGAFPYVKLYSVANAAATSGAHVSVTVRAITKTVVTK